MQTFHLFIHEYNCKIVQLNLETDRQYFLSKDIISNNDKMLRNSKC